jgi:outer membrane protein TolC
MLTYRHRFLRRLFIFIWYSLSTGFGWPLSSAVAQDALPDPLTLEAALKFSERMGSTSIALASSEVEMAELEIERASSINPTSVYLNLVPRAVKRTGAANDDFINDSFARFSVNKVLYDFGRSRTLKSIADTELMAQHKLLELTRHTNRLIVLERFLDVLLADRRYEIDTEEMTISFIHYDRLRERRQLFDEVSEIEVAAADAAYRRLLARRTESELQQQYTRLQLAIALGKPGDLPRDLLQPDLRVWTDREIPDYRTNLEAALASNPKLLALKDALSAARQYAENAGLDLGPRLLGGVELTEYATVRAARDDTRATVRLQIPLFNGKLKRIDQRQADIELLQAELEIMNVENALRDELFQLVRNVIVLGREMEAADSSEYYRDLYLDQSRALYDMEVRTDLGDAQAKLLEAGWQVMRAKFGTAVTWAKIDMLLGKAFTYSE